VYPGPIEDFRLDALSISSYTTQDDPYGDLLLAHGVVDNINVLLPPPPVEFCTGGFTNGVWQVQCTSRTNWSYDLQRTTDFLSWTNVANSAGTGSKLVMQDLAPSAGNGFYRVRARRVE